MSIDILDHIIIRDSEFLSFKEHGLMQSRAQGSLDSHS